MQRDVSLYTTSMRGYVGYERKLVEKAAIDTFFKRQKNEATPFENPTLTSTQYYVTQGSPVKVREALEYENVDLHYVEFDHESGWLATEATKPPIQIAHERGNRQITSLLLLCGASTESIAGDKPTIGNTVNPGTVFGLLASIICNRSNYKGLSFFQKVLGGCVRNSSILRARSLQGLYDLALQERQFSMADALEEYKAIFPDSKQILRQTEEKSFEINRMFSAYHQFDFIRLINLMKVDTIDVESDQEFCAFFIAFFNYSLGDAVQWFANQSLDDATKQRVIQKMIEAQSTVKGFLNEFVVNCFNTQLSKYPHKLETLQYVTYDKPLLITAIQRYLLDSGIFPLEIKINEDHSVEVINELSPDRQLTVASAFEKFGIQVRPRPKLDDQPQRVKELNEELAVIDAFETEMIEILDQQPYCRRRFANWSCADMVWAIGWTGLIASSAAIIGMSVTMVQANNRMHDMTLSPGTSCWDACQATNWHTGNPACDNLCGSGLMLIPIMLTGIFGFIPFFLTTADSFPDLKYRFSTSTKTKFWLFADMTISDISQSAVASTTKLLSFFQRTSNHLLKRIHPEQTPLGELVDAENKLAQSRVKELKDWGGEPRSKVIASSSSFLCCWRRKKNTSSPQVIASPAAVSSQQTSVEFKTLPTRTPIAEPEKDIPSSIRWHIV